MIQITNIVKKFDAFTALDGVTLTIPTGTAYGLIGSNGAGKSTLLRLLSGVYNADGGEITIDEQKIYDNAATKAKLFFVNDETIQYHTYTLKELSNMYKLFYDNYSDTVFEELRNVLQLPVDKKLSSFSKGMKRQSALIFGIACKTEYLFLDEVFDGLDPTMRIVVKKMLADTIKTEGLTVILSSHNLKEIDELCDSAGLIHKGNLVFNRQLGDIKGNIHKIQTAFDDPDSVDLSDIEILQKSQTGSVIHLIVKGEPEELRAKINARSPKILDILPLSLEEVFIHELEVLGYEYNRNDN
ncbi:MAG: ABC transporter ATP-binding protein [Oscillospiraceae bacterium]|nr:ABC transporter ATP-binding protein [Oscillospiraceae bacterium]